jgi:hypothetical protein
VLEGEAGVVELLASTLVEVSWSWGGDGGGDSCMPLLCADLSREEGVEGDGRGAVGLGEKYWQLTWSGSLAYE